MLLCLDLDTQLTGKICFDKWTIYILYNVSNDVLLKFLKNINCPFLYLINNTQSYGFTYSNYSLKSSVLYIHKHNNILELINTISHESTHLMYHILNSQNQENNCKLVGDLTELILEKFVY